MKIVIIGSPGCGKSTVSKMLAETMGIKYISTGDISRSMNTPPGMMANESAMRSHTKDALANCDNFVLDGLPRFMDQAQWLSSIVGNYHMFCLALESGIAISRMLKRGRHDDTRDIVLKRIIDYKKTTYPIIQAAKDGKLECTCHIIRVGDMHPTEIQCAILKQINWGGDRCASTDRRD